MFRDTNFVQRLIPKSKSAWIERETKSDYTPLSDDLRRECAEFHQLSWILYIAMPETIGNMGPVTQTGSAKQKRNFNNLIWIFGMETCITRSGDWWLRWIAKWNVSWALGKWIFSCCKNGRCCRRFVCIFFAFICSSFVLRFFRFVSFFCLFWLVI